MFDWLNVWNYYRGDVVKAGVYVGLCVGEFSLKDIYKLPSTRINKALFIQEVTANFSYAGNYRVHTVSLIIAKCEPIQQVYRVDKSEKEDENRDPIEDCEYIEYDVMPWCDIPAFVKLRNQCQFKYIGENTP